MAVLRNERLRPADRNSWDREQDGKGDIANEMAIDHVRLHSTRRRVFVRRVPAAPTHMAVSEFLVFRGRNDGPLAAVGECR